MDGHGQEDELRRLLRGPNPQEHPPGLLTMVRVVAPGTAKEVAARAAEVMRVVCHHAQPWPTVAGWTGILPRWFVESCPPELTMEAAEKRVTWWRTLPPEEQARVERERKWPLADWLYWLEPAHRTWYWWDVRLEGPDAFTLAVAVPDTPARGALRWLLNASGAAVVEFDD